MRPAFSMITAIFVIAIMASVGAFVMNLSGKMIQETTAQYRKEQAILYAKSYTEYAIMAATAQSCIRNITSDIDGTQAQVKAGQGYHVHVHVQYLGANSTCTDKIGTSNVTNPDTVILIDTFVHYRDPESPAAIAGLAWSADPGITYHRRTLQRL
jgi:type II secretory pathway pseudopilin PulG